MSIVGPSVDLRSAARASLHGAPADHRTPASGAGSAHVSPSRSTEDRRLLMKGNFYDQCR